MNFLLSFLFFIIGFFSFFIIGGQIFITIFCALRMNFKLKKNHLIKFLPALRQSLFTIVVWSIILSAVIYLISLLSNAAVISFCIGFALSFIFSLKQMGMNESNINDYFNSYRKHVKCHSYEHMNALILANNCPEFKEMVESFANADWGYVLDNNAKVNDK